MTILDLITDIQSEKYANRIYPGWVSLSDIQNQIGYFPRDEIEILISESKLKHVSITQGGVAFYNPNKPLKYNESF